MSNEVVKIGITKEYHIGQFDLILIMRDNTKKRYKLKDFPSRHGGGPIIMGCWEVEEIKEIKK